MLCPRCRTENREGRRFCAECGASLALACAACGFHSPRSYTPKHLVEKILTSKAALEGERKQVTGPPLRGDSKSGDGPRHHGALQRAARP
jgi:hypothetical protein